MMAIKKPRKWAAFKGTLPIYQDAEDPERVELLNAIKDSIAGDSIVNIAENFSNLKKEKTKLEDELKAINLQLEARNTVLVERLENEGMQSLKLSSGENFYLSDEPYAQMKDKVRFNDWLLENDMDELRTIHWQTLNGLVKERLEVGEQIPEGVDVFMRTKVVMRRG
jgi:hypothetical protein